MSSDLLRRAKSGDRKAFDRLVERHARLVLSLARRMVGHREDAEDVAQEVFLRMFRALSGIDEQRPLEPWLVRVTLNVARNRLSRGPGRREQPLAEPYDSRAGASSSPDAALRAEEAREAVRLAALTLPSQEGTVFLLRDVQGLSAASVAEALGSSAVTVRRQSTSARRKVLLWLRRNRPELVESRGDQTAKTGPTEISRDDDERSGGGRGKT